MALFKISKGLKANLPTKYNEGWCYFTTDDGKFYIDTAGTGGTTGTRVVLNASKADALTVVSKGSSTTPVYFNSSGVPVACSYNLSTMTSNITANATELNRIKPIYNGHTHSVSVVAKGSVGSKEITPAGSVTSTFTGTAFSVTPTFTGTKATLSHTYTPSGSITAPKFTGTQASLSLSYKPSGTISKVPTTTHTHSVPAQSGTVTLSGSVSSRCLTISATYVGSACTSGGPSATAAPTFTGTSASATGTYTPAGTINSLSFAGNQATLSLEYTPAGKISTISHTPSGTVSSSFAGTKFTHDHSFTGSSASATTAATTATM